MKETAINSIYLLLHCVAESQQELENLIRFEKGYVWEAYFRKDKATEEANILNRNNKTSKKLNFYHKFIVIEKKIY